jgi:adenosylmethionine-8-amino-7-oxononanoate aminotransferase
MFIDIVRFRSVKGQEQESYALQSIIKTTIVRFIYEPLVQGAAGMVMYEPESLDKLMRFVKKMVFLRLQTK